MRRPSAPRHLGTDGRRLWRRVVADFDLPPAALALLESACLSYGQMLQARRLVDAEGLVVAGRYGPRVNPAVQIERDAAERMRRALRALEVDLAAVEGLAAVLPGLPPEVG